MTESNAAYTTEHHEDDSQEQAEISPKVHTEQSQDVELTVPAVVDDLPDPLKTVKEAFPDIDTEVIEAILESQRGEVESTFEVLLSMSDPTYQPISPAPPTAARVDAEAAPATPQHQQPYYNYQTYPSSTNRTPPPKPPRPQQRDPTYQFSPYAYEAGDPAQDTLPQQPISVQEQMRMDEHLARHLVMEDQRQHDYEYQRHQQAQRQQQKYDSDDDEPLFNFQEEFPVMKEKVIEAGNAAKRKLMDFITQIKTNRTTKAAGSSSSIPTTHVHYRGLPNDDGDDLLTGDMSALHLSDNDVYAQTRGATKPQPNPSSLVSSEAFDEESQEPRVIHVNPPYPTSLKKEEQLLEDEALARRLAKEEEEEEEAHRSEFEGSIHTYTSTTATRVPSPIPLSTATNTGTGTGTDTNTDTNTITNTSTPYKNSKNLAVPLGPVGQEEERPYVIGDDESEDELVDADDSSDKPEAKHSPHTSEQK